jgi:hypothetical protein
MIVFSGKTQRRNKEKIFTLIRLMTEISTIIKRKFALSLNVASTFQADEMCSISFHDTG